MCMHTMLSKGSERGRRRPRSLNDLQGGDPPVSLPPHGERPVSCPNEAPPHRAQLGVVPTIARTLSLHPSPFGRLTSPLDYAGSVSRFAERLRPGRPVVAGGGLG